MGKVQEQESEYEEEYASEDDRVADQISILL
jgi:hypothetical protein